METISWEPIQGYTYYRSGLGKSPSDLEGMMEAWAPVGVSAMGLGPTTAGRLVEYTQAGGQVFVDSGAFGAFRSGQPLDWDQVLKTYRRLAINGHGVCYSVVVPDVIGRPWETLKLVDSYQEQIGGLMELGVRCILPWQVQVMHPDDFMEALWQMVDHDIAGYLIPGIPSNARALSLATAQRIVILGHQEIHLLGMGEGNPLFARTLAELRSVDYDLEISCDSNPLPSWYSRGRSGARYVMAMSRKGVSSREARRQYARLNAGPDPRLERRHFERYGMEPHRPDLQASLPPLQGLAPSTAACQMSFI